MLKRLSAERVLMAATSAACAALWTGVASAQIQTTTPPSTGDRVLGLDISAWQGNISQTTWNNIYNIENREFVFIRSSRGGTTGYYNQSDPNNNLGQNTLSQRYDDPYFVQNITRATAAGMLAGSYHFSRPDIIESTLNSGGIRNNGTDEANHFIEMAGAFMRPGFLLPVHDLEAGISQRTRNELTQFALDFSNRIYDVMGIRPAIYINGSYVDYVSGSSLSLRSQLPTAYPTLWVARWPNQSDPNSIPVQTSNPKATYPNFYGAWDAISPQPWAFWQYASTGRLQSFNNGNSNLDMNVAQGNIEFVKDYLVPAVWMNNSSGNWHDLSNWNSGQAPIVPVQGPGQVARVGPLTLPTPRLPGQPDATHPMVTGADDTVNLNRPDANITVTLSTGSYNIRRLNLNERLNMTGGSLNIGKTAWVGTGGTLSLSGGTFTVDEALIDPSGALEFAGGGTLNARTLYLNTGASFTGSSGTGLIAAKAGAASPSLDLLGGTRTFTVADGSADVDMRIALPLTNGHLTKQGLGTLQLTGNNSSYTGTLTVSNGHLLVTNANQLGTSGVRTTQSSGTTGGSVRLQGSGLNITRSIQLGGLGSGGNDGGGALENVSGNNTWSGNVILAGAQHNQGQTGLNQIGAAAGSTLTLSGVIQDNVTGVLRSWAKVGDGDVVLTGSSPNTYTNLTRTFGGRLILEKDAALGAGGSDLTADGNTYMLPDAASTIAFRAPASSPSGFQYNTVEWIHTEGPGINGVQIDNLGGNNSFAGHLGLGGPIVNGTRESYLGVSAGSLELKGGLYARSTVAPEARNIFKRGAGTLIISGDSGPAPTHNSDRSLIDSSLTIEAGTVLLAGTAGNTANVPGITTWNVSNGATLSLGKTGATGNATIVLGGGSLHTSAAGVAVAGDVALGAGGSGGTVNTAGAASSITLDGVVSNPSGKSLHKIGAGTLILNGPQSHGSGAAFFANGGTTRFNNNAGAAGPVALHAANSGTRVLLHSSQSLAAVQLSQSAYAELATGANKSLKSSGLSITTGAQLEIKDNGLILGNSLGQVYEMVAAGWADGSWDGSGIVSAGARMHEGTGVGYGPGSALAGAVGGSFFGQSYSDSSVLVRWTLLGDADLNGTVNINDFNLLAANFNIGQYWHEGDFNYDGAVNINDFNIFAQQFSKSLMALGDEPTAADWDALRAAVPEPSSLGLVAVAAMSLLRRRRRAV